MSDRTTKLMEKILTLPVLCILSATVFVLYGLHFVKEASRFSDSNRSIGTKVKNKRLAILSFVFASMFFFVACYIFYLSR